MAKNSPEPQAAPAIKVRVDVPQPIFERYEAKARALNRDVEELIGEHLRQTVGHDTTSGGMWFDAAEMRELFRFTGRGSTADPKVVIERLRPLLQILVGDVITELDGQVIDRLKHIPKHLTVQGFLSDAALNGIRTQLGMSPKHMTRPARRAETKPAKAPVICAPDKYMLEHGIVQ